MNHTVIAFDCGYKQPEPFKSTSVEVTLKFSAEEWAWLTAVRTESDVLDSMTGFIKQVVLARAIE